jgi:hypothetical protein
MYGDHDVSGGVEQMLAHNVPSGVWPFVWAAFVVGAMVDLFLNQVCIMVHEGTFTGDLLTDVPITPVEKEVRGKMSTLLAVWETYGEVPCVMKAYMALSLKSVQITMMRERYVENTIDRLPAIENAIEGYRRVVWLTLVAPDGPRSWPRVAPAAMEERTAALLCKAVFSLD